MLKVLTCTLLFFATIYSNPVDFVIKCKYEDWQCMTRSGQVAWSMVANGIPELGIQSSEPLKVKIVQNDQNGLKLKFTDLVVSGLKTCIVNDVRIDLKKNTFVFEVECKFDVTGDYELGGQILVLPVQGKGDFNILLKKLRIRLFGELNQKVNKDGKMTLYVQKFQQKSMPVEPIVFKFNNLFDGNKELSDTIHNVINNSYEEVLNEVGQPILDAIYKQVLKTAMKLLKSLPVDEYFLN